MSTNDMLFFNRAATPSVAPHPSNKPGAGIPENALKAGSLRTRSTKASISLSNEKFSVMLLFFFEIILWFLIIKKLRPAVNGKSHKGTKYSALKRR